MEPTKKAGMDHAIEEMDAVEMRVVVGIGSTTFTKKDIDTFLDNLSISKTGRLLWPKGGESGILGEVYFEKVFHPKRGFEEEGFIWVESQEKADKLVELQRQRFRFYPPAQSSSERAIWRRIGENLRRLEDIVEELEDIGAVQGIGTMHYVLPARFVEADDLYEQELALLTQQINSGQAADFRYLLNKPVDLAGLNDRLRVLNADRIHVLIALRGFQKDGFHFAIPGLG